MIMLSCLVGKRHAALLSFVRSFFLSSELLLAVCSSVVSRLSVPADLMQSRVATTDQSSSLRESCRCAMRYLQPRIATRGSLTSIRRHAFVDA